MGKAKKRVRRLDFNRRLRLEFRRARITFDAGLVAYREVDDALAFVEAP